MEAFECKHIYRVPTIRVTDKALAGFLNNVSVQRQPTQVRGGEESKELILQPKQPLLRKRVHIHSQKVITSIDQQSLPRVSLEVARRKARRSIVRLSTSDSRTDVGRTMDAELSQASMQLLRRHVSLRGHYDFALLSRPSKVPQTSYVRSVLRKSLSFL